MSINPRQFAIQVTEKLQSAGYQALWAGGCVRDQLLNVPPSDYDIATNATPDQIRELFGHRKTLPLGAAFGVITVIGPRSAGNIEVATFRRDADYSDGRRPDSVAFSTAEMDAQRRDFTINGLFFDPVNEVVIDYVGGQADLKQGVVRAIGNAAERIAEDKLRMLRAVRFAANLNFELDPETFDTIKCHASEIGIVSAERIAAELRRMLIHPQRRLAVELLIESGLLVEILPETRPLLGDPAKLNPVLARLESLTDPSLAVVLATILETVVEAQEFPVICKRLKLPNEVADCGLWILENADSIRQAPGLPWSTIQPLLLNPCVTQALDFLEAGTVQDGLPMQVSDATRFCRDRLAWAPEKLNPPQLLNGNLMRQHHFRPGPQFGEILSEVRRAQLDGEITTTGQALEIARRIVDEKNRLA